MALMSQEEDFGCDCTGAGSIRYEPSFAAVEGVLAADLVSLVSGRLRSHSAFWLEDLKASSFAAAWLCYLGLPIAIYFSTKH